MEQQDVEARQAFEDEINRPFPVIKMLGDLVVFLYNKI